MVGKMKHPTKRGPPLPASRTLSTTAASMDEEEEEGCIEEEPAPPPAKKQNTGRDWPQDGGYRGGGGPGAGGPPYFDRGNDRRDAYPPFRQEVGRGERLDPKHRPALGGGSHGRDSPGPRRVDDRFDSRPPFPPGGHGREGRDVGQGMVGGGRGGPPPGWRGDERGRRPPPPGYYDDRGPDPRDRRGPPPPMYDRERPPDGWVGGRGPMDSTRGPEYDKDRDKNRDRGMTPNHRGAPSASPEKMDFLARTRDMGRGNGGGGLMFGRRGEGGAFTERSSRDSGAAGRGGGHRGPRDMDMEGYKVRADAAKTPQQKRSKDILTDKDVYDQTQLQVMLLEYKSTMACLDAGLRAKVNPVSIPFEQASTPRDRTKDRDSGRDRGRDGEVMKNGPPFVDARGAPPISRTHRGGPADRGPRIAPSPGLDRGERPFYTPNEGKGGHPLNQDRDRERDKGMPAPGYRAGSTAIGGPRGKPPPAGISYGGYGRI